MAFKVDYSIFYLLTNCLFFGINMNFTKPAIEKLECMSDSKPSFYWDSSTSGFGVKVTPNNKKTYIFQGRIGSKTRRITIGNIKDWRLTEAREKAKELAVLCSQGIDPVIEKAKRIESDIKYGKESKRKEIKFRDAWELYLAANKDHWRPRSYQDHLDLCRGGYDAEKNYTYKEQPIKQLLEIKLVDLTSDVFIDWLNKNSFRATTASKSYRLVRAFLNWCNEDSRFENLLPSKSFNTKTVRRNVSPINAKKDCLTKQQLPLWFNEVSQISNKKISTFFISTLITGSRKDELLALEWKDIDFEWKKIKLKDKVDHTGREIPLTKYVEKLFLQLKVTSDSQFVFSSSTSKCGYIVNPYKTLNKVTEKLNIELTPHGLRRSFETLAGWTKVDKGVLAQISGHKPSALVERHYTVRPIDMLREELQEYENWLLKEAKIIL